MPAQSTQPKPSQIRLGEALPIAIVGAGMAGLTCARQLARVGHAVTVVDKSRGPGGRMSTRRTEVCSFDHGAQYFTAREAAFLFELKAWLDAGIAQEWTGRLAAIGSDSTLLIRGDNPRFVGVPGMSALTRQLARSVDTVFDWQAIAVERRGGEWWLRERGGAELGPFAAAVVAVPAPQAAPLLAAAPELARRAAAVKMAGCYAVMAAFDEPLDLPFDGAFSNVGPLSWFARNSSKAGREGAEAWVLHASPDWSEEHIEEPPDRALPALLAGFAEAVKTPIPEPALTIAHRWRYALPITLVQERCLYDPLLAIGACGDWCAGPRVEGAFLSGMAMADRMIASLGRP